jgi:hypothetical protein
MCDIFITLILYNYYVLLLPFVNIDYYSVNGSLEINNLGVLKDNRKIRFLIIIINNNNLIGITKLFVRIIFRTEGY